MGRSHAVLSLSCSHFARSLPAAFCPAPSRYFWGLSPFPSFPGGCGMVLPYGHPPPFYRCPVRSWKAPCLQLFCGMDGPIGRVRGQAGGRGGRRRPCRCMAGGCADKYTYSRHAPLVSPGQKDFPYGQKCQIYRTNILIVHLWEPFRHGCQALYRIRKGLAGYRGTAISRGPAIWYGKGRDKIAFRYGQTYLLLRTKLLAGCGFLRTGILVFPCKACKKQVSLSAKMTVKIAGIFSLPLVFPFFPKGNPGQIYWSGG